MTTLPTELLFGLFDFGVLEKDSAWTSCKVLSSMGGMFLAYSFEPRPNNHMLAIVSFFMTIGLSINRQTQTRKNQFEERKQDWLVQKFGLWQLQKFDMLPAKPPFVLLTQEDKRVLCSETKHQNVKGTKSTKKGSFCGNILIFCSVYKKFFSFTGTKFEVGLTINLT